MEYTASYGANPFSLLFNGSSDYVDTRDLPFYSQFTIECWVRLDEARINSFFTDHVSNVSYQTISFRADATNRIVLQIIGDAGGTINKSVQTLNTLAIGVWTHVAGVFDGTNLMVYINGVLNNTASAGGAVPYSNNKAFVIGVDSRPEGTFKSWMKGAIDDFRFWSVARTQSEIQTNMTRQQFANQTGLEMYLPFREGGGSVTVDKVTNSNNTIVGATWTSSTPPLTYVIDAKTDWVSNNSINFDSFNRIEKNIGLVRDYVIGLQYVIQVLNLVTNRTQMFIDTLDSINRIESNLEIIRTNLAFINGYPGPKTWALGVGFDYNDANRLETNVLMIFQTAQAIAQSFIYCGQINCGQGGVL